MVNVNKLKGKITECGLNVDKLSSMIGMAKSTFYRKIRADGADFTISEADKIAKALGCTLEEVNAIFFA